MSQFHLVLFKILIGSQAQYEQIHAVTWIYSDLLKGAVVGVVLSIKILVHRGVGFVFFCSML